MCFNIFILYHKHMIYSDAMIEIEYYRSIIPHIIDGTRYTIACHYQQFLSLSLLIPARQNSHKRKHININHKSRWLSQRNTLPHTSPTMLLQTHLLSLLGNCDGVKERGKISSLLTFGPGFFSGLQVFRNALLRRQHRLVTETIPIFA